ncbi:MAG: recombinase family protein [Bacteroidales bacterium]|nr:recombinase family protein [Bacteroidales bacterium]
MSKKFISWRRVSTKQQGASHLGLEAQKSIIDHFVKVEGGELIADYSEVYTGTELSGCTQLRKAMKRCKKEGATLIIAKTDRFRNTVEALQIFDEMEGDIYFCDLPAQEKFVLTLFFALAEREALLISIRTKSALAAKKARGEKTGGTNELWGKITGASRKDAVTAAAVVSAKVRRDKAKNDPANIAFKEFMEDWRESGKALDWAAIADKLNSRGKKTTTGLAFTPVRARAMYEKTRKLYSTKQVWTLS